MSLSIERRFSQASTFSSRQVCGGQMRECAFYLPILGGELQVNRESNQPGFLRAGMFWLFCLIGSCAPPPTTPLACNSGLLTCDRFGPCLSHTIHTYFLVRWKEKEAVKCCKLPQGFLCVCPTGGNATLQIHRYS